MRSRRWYNAQRGLPSSKRGVYTTLPALGETEAVGMALAQLVLSGVKGKPLPTKLVAVDSAHISFQVAGRHAELWNLRVRAAADGTWVTLGACYDNDDEHGWVVTSLGTSPGCA